MSVSPVLWWLHEYTTFMVRFSQLQSEINRREYDGWTTITVAPSGHGGFLRIVMKRVMSPDDAYRFSVAEAERRKASSNE